MVLAWSLTEVPRYAFYLLSLNGAPPRALLYVRYTTFFLLYPLGAASEAFLIYATLPPTSPYPERGWRAVVWGIWTLGDYVRGLLFLVWWPCGSFSAFSVCFCC
jgi:very-long-chain (3R)-3-hydroxyacyl-CoA dehydratase